MRLSGSWPWVQRGPWKNKGDNKIEYQRPDEEVPTYDAWKFSLTDGYSRECREDGDTAWICIDEWLFNAKENRVYDRENVAYHVCLANYNRIYHRDPNESNYNMTPSISDIEKGCLMCGTPMPDGTKMIALLEKL